ncbi:MAG: hypothetical protein AAFR71_02570 [Pseudomonadota bacterium]
MKLLGLAAAVAACAMIAVMAVSGDGTPANRDVDREDVVEKKGCVEEKGEVICYQSPVPSGEAQ